MKYLKTYENLNEYKVGDYVHLKNKWRIYPDVKIIKFINKNHYDEFRVEAQKKSNNKLKMLWVDLEEIERKSTPEEIEEYNLRKNISKYNL